MSAERDRELRALAVAAGVKPHDYVVSVGHMTHWDDAYHCCRFGVGHPIHTMAVRDE